MLDRIIKIISILSFLMSVSMAAFGYVAIRYMQSPEFERTLKNKIMGSLEDKLPDVMGDKIPNLTGPSIQLPEKKKLKQDNDPDKWFWDYIEKRNKEQIYWETEGKWKQ